MKSLSFIVACLALSVAHPIGPAWAAAPVLVDLNTNLGVIRLELDADKAPRTVANFVNYVKNGHYDGTVFHRVIKDFMIQGGGLTPDLKEKSTEPPVVNESNNGLQNKKYSIAMARTSDPHSATSQFFINTSDNAFLDRANAQDGAGYAVFGKVIDGQKVVDAIAGIATATKADPLTGVPLQDVPVQPIVIDSAKIVEGR